MRAHNFLYELRHISRTYINRNNIIFLCGDSKKGRPPKKTLSLTNLNYSLFKYFTNHNNMKQ